MRLYNYLNEYELNESIKSTFFSIVNNLTKKSEDEIKSLLKKNWDKLVSSIKKNDLEDEFHKITRKAFGKKVSINEINEVTADPERKGFKNWLKSLIFQGRIGAGIFTSLQIFFQLDGLLEGEMPNLTKVLVYAFLWVALSTWVYKDWQKGDA